MENIARINCSEVDVLNKIYIVLFNIKEKYRLHAYFVRQSA